jgi:hypothetical protein
MVDASQSKKKSTRNGCKRISVKDAPMYHIFNNEKGEGGGGGINLEHKIRYKYILGLKLYRR